MIFSQKGKLSVVQVLTAGATNSTNVIQMVAADYAGLTDLWWVVDTGVVAGGAGTIKVALVISEEAALTTNVEVLSTLCASVADLRVATAGRHIVSVNVGKMLKEIMETAGDSTYFVGCIYTLDGSATLTVDTVLSPTEPQTLHHKMVTVSNVALPLIPSVGSGE